MDGKTWYLCDPEKNTDCRKSNCCEHGGPCELTSRKESAQLDPDGTPVMKKATEIKRNFDKPGIPFGSISGTLTGDSAERLKDILLGWIFGNKDEE